jgi:hypothetical protein
MVFPAGHSPGLCHSLKYAGHPIVASSSRGAAGSSPCHSLKYAGHLIVERIIYPSLPPDHCGMNFDGMKGRQDRILDFSVDRIIPEGYDYERI